MNEPIDERIIEAAFFGFMRDNGIVPRGNLSLIMDGQIHRFSTENDKHGGQSGAYFIYSDGCPNGGAMDYHIHTEMQKFKLNQDLMPKDSRKVLSETEYRKKKADDERRKAENEHKKQENMKLQEENEKRLIERAFCFWHSDTVNHDVEAVNLHPYMLKKKVILPPNTNCDAGIDNQGRLMFPLYDSLTGKFKDIQLISLPDDEGHSQKRFLKGISNHGLWYPVRMFKGDILFITEGIITAFSVDEFTNREYSVAAAMSCANLLEVCKNIRVNLNQTRKYNPNLPNQKIIVAADNDKNHAGENAAQKVIEAGYADDYRMPPIEGYDWNDYVNYMKGQNE